MSNQVQFLRTWLIKLIILQTITAEEWESGEKAEAMLIYLGQVYYAFRGEIPHLKHNKTIVSVPLFNSHYSRH